MQLYTICDKNFEVLKNLETNEAYFYETLENAEIFINNLLKKDDLKTNLKDLDKNTLQVVHIDYILKEVKKQIKYGKEKAAVKRENKIYAIFDPETNSYMQSFVVSNIIQAKRNLEIAKKNLKETCGEADFINKLELRELKEDNA